jgi:hypothetical protein
MALAALLATAAGVARADGPSPGMPPRWGSLQLTVGTFKPDIDSGTFTLSNGLTATPYATAFGNSSPLLIKLLFSRSVWVSEVGTLDVGLGVGYWQVSGQGIFVNNSGGQETGSSTSLLILPVTLALGYRFDVFFDQWGVPLEPYVRGALVDKIWWANGTGSPTSPFPGTAQGATYGWSATLGVALVLDALDPALARQMTYDTGIAHTMLTVDFTKENVDDFGSKTSWQLGQSSWMWSAGILFVF